MCARLSVCNPSVRVLSCPHQRTYASSFLSYKEGAVYWLSFQKPDALRRPVRDAYCPYRCSRIYQRSLSLMNENLGSVQYLFDRLEPTEEVSRVCWKSYDFLDCMEHCELQNRKRLTVIRNVIKDRCHSFMQGDEMNLACISKYHTVVEVRCLSYLSEASQRAKNWQQTPSQQSYQERTVAKEKATSKKLFSPDIDLLDVPPNFFYSSLKLTSSGMKEREKDAYSEKQSGNGIDFGTRSNNHKEINAEEHVPKAVDEPFENTDVAIYVDNFTRPSTKTTSATSTTVTENALTENYPSSYDLGLPVATVMTHKLLSVFPPVAISETDSSVARMAQYSTLPQMATSTIKKTSTPSPALPLTKTNEETNEIYTIKLSTVLESTVISKSEVAKQIKPTTRINGVEYVETLSATITDNEHFENLMNTGQMDATTVTTVASHHVTLSSRASAIISTLHPSLTLTSTPATATILQPMVTVPPKNIIPLKNITTQNTLIPFEVTGNISKAKFYKVFSTPASTTALTKQMFMLENAELQTTTVNPAIWSSGTKFHEVVLKLMSRINNKTSPKTASSLEAITRIAAALGKRRESNSLKIDFLKSNIWGSTSTCTTYRLKDFQGSLTVTQIT
uniref:Uncharacterized protein n=1 Tax=Setaria digitata TaxID=48799 RepID=A0A915Q0S0_9BILA